uniref:RING-type E3 ubiquitin transferase n=1 Tax=Chinchilla lanigera TaxID=34839 RepID=A0A8C2W321_CHILA
MLSIAMLMLAAPEVYTILTVQLFAFLNLLPVGADILAYNFENASQTFDNLPAKLGYRPPGFLINSKPENACKPIMSPPVKDNSSGAFIVLIRRLDYNFDIKVLNAQRVGYKAAIVHNVDSEDLISMGSSDIDMLKNTGIPCLYCYSLKDELTYDKGGHIILVPEFSLPLEYYLILFLIIVGICLILIDRHRARRNRLGKDQLKKLPVCKFKRGGEYDVYGHKLGILPCSHAYHCKCVDPGAS